MGLGEYFFATSQRKLARKYDRNTARMKANLRTRVPGARGASAKTRPVGPARRSDRDSIRWVTGKFGKNPTRKGGGTVKLPSGKVGSGGATYLGGGGRKIDNGPLKTQTQPTGQTIVNALPYKRTQGKYPAVKRNPSPLTKRPKRNPRGPRPTIR